jgi:hypothetical protein
LFSTQQPLLCLLLLDGVAADAVDEFECSGGMLAHVGWTRMCREQGKRCLVAPYAELVQRFGPVAGQERFELSQVHLQRFVIELTLIYQRPQPDPRTRLGVFRLTAC